MRARDLYTDGVKPFFPGVMERIQRYDPRLFLRWNRTQGQYELWRFRPDLPIPSRPTTADIEARATCQIMVRPEDFDHRVFRRLWLADLAHRSPNLTADEVNKQLERQDKAREEADAKEIKTQVEDLVADNRREIKEDFLNVYSGYYG